MSSAVRFLVVDDNDLDVENIERGFRRFGIANEIVRAKHGYDALDVLRGTNGREKLDEPYVILLDLNMPRMTGHELLAELRSDDGLADASVFVLTTSDRQKDVDFAERFDIQEYVVKPVKMDRLFASLGKMNLIWTLTKPMPTTGERDGESG